MKNSGEIKIDSKMGQKILELSSNEKYITFVETGTKNGDGSTFCFLSGLLKRGDKSKLYSIETNSIFYENAKNNCVDIPKGKLSLLNGSLVKYSELPDMSVWNNIRKEEYVYNIDLKKSMCVYDEIPKQIDVLLLDSGGWSRQGEWDKIKTQIDVILLDDTKISTNNIRTEILNNPDTWEITNDEINDRNGWLCAIKKIK